MPTMQPKEIEQDGYLSRLRRRGEADGIPIIMEETERFLSCVLAMVQPKRILEIGTAMAYSTLFFAKNCPEGEIFTAEIDEEMLSLASANITASGAGDRIHLYPGDGADLADSLIRKEVPPMDLIFLDGGKSHYDRFLTAIWPLLRQGTVLLADNIFQRGLTEQDPRYNHKHRTSIVAMRQFMQRIETNPHLQTTILPIGDGLSLSIYRNV